MQHAQALPMSSPLLRGINETEAVALLDCLGARRETRGRGEEVLRAGENTTKLGLVLSGSVQVVQEDFWGKSSLMTVVGAGALFGEVFACVPDSVLTVSARTMEASELMQLDAQKLLNVCPSACPCHLQLIRNLLQITARKNLGMTKRLWCMSQHHLRDKLLIYLSEEAAQQGHDSFVIPWNRQQLADYLGVDRSAMCRELSRMKAEGIIDYDRDAFRLLKRGTTGDMACD